MHYIKPGVGVVEYKVLEELITDLVKQPNEIFIRVTKNCEGMVFATEINLIVLLESKHFEGSAELRSEELKRKLKVFLDLERP